MYKKSPRLEINRDIIARAKEKGLLLWCVEGWSSWEGQHSKLRGICCWPQKWTTESQK